MEGEVEGHDWPQESPQGRKDALYASAAQSCNEQPEFLPAIPVYLPTGGLQGDAKYEQQDRGNIYRLEEEPEQSQRLNTGEPQAVHFWVFPGIGI